MHTRFFYKNKSYKNTGGIDGEKLKKYILRAITMP